MASSIARVRLKLNKMLESKIADNLEFPPTKEKISSTCANLLCTCVNCASKAINKTQRTDPSQNLPYRHRFVQVNHERS